MLSRNEVKYIQSLYHKKNRDEDDVFIAEGVKVIAELVQSNFSIKKMYAVLFIPAAKVGIENPTPPADA